MAFRNGSLYDFCNWLENNSFKMTENNSYKISDPLWEADFNPQCNSLFQFELKKDIKLILDGLAGDEFTEKNASSQNIKAHKFDDFPGGTVKTVSENNNERILSRRQYEYSSNRFKIATDSDFTKGFPSNVIGIDNLVLKGNWAKIGIVYTEENNLDLIKTEWVIPKETNFETLCSSKIPLCWVFLDKNGVVFEVGTGDDLWRWDSGLSPEFRLEFTSKEARLKRNFINSKETLILNPRSFRHTWYFSWWKKEFRKYEDNAEEPNCDLLSVRIPDDKTSVIVDLNRTEWPLQAKRENSEGKFGCGVCMRSDSVWACLKKIIRKCTVSKNLNKVVIRGIRPSVCFSASHCGRSKMGKLAHRDILSLMDFKLWAERQLYRKNITIHILPQNDHEICRILPSYIGLAGYYTL